MIFVDREELLLNLQNVKFAKNSNFVPQLKKSFVLDFSFAVVRE